MKIRTLCIFLLLATSCSKNNDTLDSSDINMVCIVDIEVTEIIDPPEIPAIYTNEQFQPTIIVRNSEYNTIITSLDIDYLIDINNLNNGYEKGPQTKWTGTLNYGEEVKIYLNPWDTLAGNTPLENGVHSVIFEISGVNENCIGPIATEKPILRQLQLER